MLKKSFNRILHISLYKQPSYFLVDYLTPDKRANLYLVSNLLDVSFANVLLNSGRFLSYACFFMLGIHLATSISYKNLTFKSLIFAI